ncbi:MAG: hypothetical protein ACREIF_06975 [Chthoniobacterales bacterium]
MTGARASASFLVGSFLICLAVFRGALWGSTVLAPLDIAPTLLGHYRYVDPAAGHIPANHYIIDQLTFDLPLQHTIYSALHRGEFPWWDPYTYGGRPLLADAHINGTDPIRLFTFWLLPFVPAYNWNLILKSILTGLGMFVLLRDLGFSFAVGLSLALTYQFAGCFALFFGHPWIQASFAYYPFLWVVWSRGLHSRFWLHAAFGAVLCGLIFYSGNLQSHAYLPLFALCFLLAHAVGKKLSKVFRLITFSGLAGAALAAPVLFPQVEFFTHSIRGIATSSVPRQFLGGLLSLGAVFPWMFGTFRALDLGKFLDMNGAAFALFIGSSLFVLALIGLLRKPPANGLPTEARLIATFMVILYLIVCSTPLIHILYTRMSPFAVMGLIVLAAYGLEHVRGHPLPFRKVGWTVIALATLLVIALNVAAFVVYPRVIKRVSALVTSHEATNPSFGFAPALRQFQVVNLPREISFLNLETVVAFAGLILLGVYLLKKRPQPVLFGSVLLLNFLPVVHFYDRFIPHQPRVYWERLLKGGPEQERVASVVRPRHLRLLDVAPGTFSMLFPFDMGHLQTVHTVHGYSALQPVSLFNWPFPEKPPPGTVADYIYRTKEVGASTGDLGRLTSNGLARFQCGDRKVSVLSESLNTLKLSISPGPASTLRRTDTDYPGWTASMKGQEIPIAHGKMPFSSVQVPTSPDEAIITFHYRPSHLTLAFCLSACALLAMVAAVGMELSGRSRPGLDG